MGTCIVLQILYQRTFGPSEAKSFRGGSEWGKVSKDDWGWKKDVWWWGKASWRSFPGMGVGKIVYELHWAGLSGNKTWDVGLLLWDLIFILLP